MNDLILAFNAGSSTLKIAAYPVQHPSEAIFSLSIEFTSGLTHHKGSVLDAFREFEPCQSLEDIAATIVSNTNSELGRVVACTHRVLHGGRKHHKPQMINNAVLAELEALEVLCPLHQPPALEIIYHLRKLWPDVLQIAVFDTAFHRQQPRAATTYALPAALRNMGIQAYGYHGISCQHVMRELTRLHPELACARVLIAHLGSGASMTAVNHGESVANSMGFSTLDGLPMSTRAGQLDAGILLYLLEQGWTRSRLTDLLYHQSGLLGLSEISGDMRVLLMSDSDTAHFAIEYFCYRAARTAASLAGALEGLDVLVFTGGIGEHQPEIRKKIVKRLAWLGGQIDAASNAVGFHTISSLCSRFRILVIPADEQRELSLQSQDLLAEQQLIGSAMHTAGE